MSPNSGSPRPFRDEKLRVPTVAEHIGISSEWMKPPEAPRVPGNTEFERFDSGVRKVLTVSKEEFLKEDAKWKRKRRPQVNCFTFVYLRSSWSWFPRHLF
jgi:hypothetical protein